MSWNYRLIKSVRESGTEIYTIHEAFYEDGFPDLYETTLKKPDSVASDPVALEGLTRAELATFLNQLFTAFDYPALESFRYNIHAKYERTKVRRKANDLVDLLQKYKAEAKKWRKEYLRLNSDLAAEGKSKRKRGRVKAPEAVASER